MNGPEITGNVELSYGAYNLNIKIQNSLRFISGLILIFSLCQPAYAFNNSQDLNNNTLDYAGVQDLIALLISDSFAKRNRAMHDILEISKDPGVLTALENELESADAIGRITITFTLFLAGDDPDVRFHELMDIFSNGSIEEQTEISHLLSVWLDPALHSEYIDAIVHLWSFELDPYVKVCLLSVLGSYVVNSEVLDLVISAAYDPSIEVKFRAAMSLGSTQGEYSVLAQNPKIIDTLIYLLNDPDPGVRGMACSSLGSHGYSDEVYYALLNVYGTESSVNTRSTALLQIARIGPKEVTAPMVLNALQSQNRQFRVLATAAVSYIGNYPGFVQSISDILEEGIPRWGIFIYAGPYYQLQLLGSDACDAIPTLISIIEQRRDDADNAIETLKYISTCQDDVIPTLKDVLINESNYYLIKEAILAAGEIGTSDGILIPELIGIAGTDSFEYYTSEWPLSYYAVDSLGEFGDFEIELEPELKALLEDSPDEAFAVHLHLALFKLNSDPEIHKQKIFDALFSDDELVVDNALWACGELGPLAYEMLPKIQELVEIYMNTHVLFGWQGVLQKITAEH